MIHRGSRKKGAGAMRRDEIERGRIGGPLIFYSLSRRSRLKMLQVKTKLLMVVDE